MRLCTRAPGPAMAELVRWGLEWGDSRDPTGTCPVSSLTRNLPVQELLSNTLKNGKFHHRYTMTPLSTELSARLCGFTLHDKGLRQAASRGSRGFRGFRAIAATLENPAMP